MTNYVTAVKVLVDCFLKSIMEKKLNSNGRNVLNIKIANCRL